MLAKAFPLGVLCVQPLRPLRETFIVVPAKGSPSARLKAQWRDQHTESRAGGSKLPSAALPLRENFIMATDSQIRKR